ncbi:MAG: phospho-sugar mutase, partial [Verrucomicrobiaceae bacterium]
MSDLRSRIQQACAAGHLFEASVKFIESLLDRSSSPLTEASITELVDAQEWTELNDRFYKTLVFGTGGLRGRTIGKIVTKAEQGAPQPLGRPEFPCVGTNAMNSYNVSRATQGLVLYVKEWQASQGV